MASETYFKNKNNAGNVCKIGTYLKNNSITDGDLDDNKVLTEIAKLMPIKNVKPEQLKETIRAITIDTLKTKLWLINTGVLFIAGVEYVLFPYEDYEQEDGTMSRMFISKEVYDGNVQRMNEAFRALFIGSVLEDKKLKPVQNFFKIKRHTLDKPENLDPIREYLNTIDFVDEDKMYIKNELSKTFLAKTRK
ncbi:uncharacterized protein LOC106654860 [Trichogramma pretiosum]|uniref:uncharacterized protein LOC106654860 n=1 Tax=Trichogramma pretiosum TaxID=7493 RepID=UPI0006C9C23A|nr:uncharacterized protein LOC106654860 [Trichogramma pretiosum]